MFDNYSEVFTLFVLGTDGKYTPDEGYLSELSAEPLQKEKLKQAKLQNTLSFIAKSIASERMAGGLIDIQDTQGNLPKQMKLFLRNVVLLEGPDTSGSEVHNITAYGVLAILNAILQDKKKINLVGFSRGAVIIIQIVNYLQSMKDKLATFSRDNLTNDDFFTKILMCGKQGNSLTPGGWIRNRIEYSKKSILNILDNPDHLKKIIDFFNSPHIEFRMFCLDPVQGPKWNHEKHYQIPKMVKKIEILYHEDERSYGFNPLHPNAQNSISSYLHIPGFHGIGDGNLFDHNFENLNLTEKELSDRRLIQEIVLLKIFRMLKNSGVQFQPLVSFKTHLDFCLSEFIKLNDSDDLLLKYYQELLNCLPQLPIDSWRNGAYVDLSIVAPKDLGTNPRQVKSAKGKLEKLDELLDFNLRNDRKFINKEHLHLAFKRMLDEYKNFPDHDVSMGQILALLNRLVKKMGLSDLDKFFMNYTACQEQSKMAYENIKLYINNLVSMCFQNKLSMRDRGALENLYVNFTKLVSQIQEGASSSNVCQRKKHLLNHIKKCFRASYQHEEQLIKSHIKKDVKSLELIIKKRSQLLNLEQNLSLFPVLHFQNLRKMTVDVNLEIYSILNNFIFSCQVLPSNFIMLKLNREIVKQFPEDWIRSQNLSHRILAEKFIPVIDEVPLLSQTPSNTFVNQNVGIGMLLTSSIALCISAGLIFSLGAVAMVPCVALGVIGLLSLIVAGNVLYLQDNDFMPPPGFSLR